MMVLWLVVFSLRLVYGDVPGPSNLTVVCSDNKMYTDLNGTKVIIEMP